ncbi:MAG TPA: glycoside hydrolase family 130 protein [Phycisphaerae bacterium]|nr:glycoside hydrolase family 130 protein [Phycisphaerae bacterium]
MPLPVLSVVRMPEKFISDDKRVITRPFLPGDEDRVKRIIERLLKVPEEAVHSLLAQVLVDFATRHKDIGDVFEEQFRQVADCLDGGPEISRERRMLIGSYFTMEYSIESAALFNPSIVPHPDQTGLPEDWTRFVMSLRATGEGHVSSIVFRTGVIDAGGEITFDPMSRYVERARKVKDRTYAKETFFLKLIEMAGYNDAAQTVLDRLGEEFTFSELVKAIYDSAEGQSESTEFQEAADNMRWLARSNYQLTFPPDCTTSEVVIFPTSENESRGIEDARFVRLVEDGGEVMYYGTYTAYNGFRVLPQLLQTPDFREFRITTLNGRYVQNKGLALFPRKFDGWYVIIGRIDGENLYLMKSTNIRFWNEAELLQQPKFPWEFVQIGNCGSPLETPAGWLMLTHGVGPMRRYCIGVTLLDLEDPSRVIGQLREPLIMPNAEEREGYVPNVVYSCGALIHNDQLIIPYAMSDSATTFARVSVPELLEHLTS